MVFPIIPVALSIIAGVGAGALVGGGGKKEFRFASPEWTKTISSNIQETITNTITKTTQISPIVEFSPIYQIESPYGEITSKKEITSEPTVEQVVTPKITPTIEAPIQEGAAGGNLMGIVAPLVLLGGVGTIAYLIIKK